MGYIYKIINDINGKMYIGKTELVNPEKRWKEHLADYKRKKFEKRPLYAAMNKYGEEHFHFEVIEETDTSDKTCEREQYWIDNLRTYVGFNDCNGYNATLGGDGKCYLKLNEDEVIKYHTEEAYCIIDRTAKYFNVDRDTVKKILDKNNIFRLTRADITRMKMYEKYGGILQINIESKIIINIFETIPEANIHMGKDIHNTNIYNACKEYSQGHLAYGYRWYYGKDINKAIRNNHLYKYNVTYI